MEDISIACGGGELLDGIERLWVELREHHAGLSAEWREGLLKGNFPERRAELAKKGSRGLLVMLASSGEETTGYCVCTIGDGGRCGGGGVLPCIRRGIVYYRARSGRERRDVHVRRIEWR